MVNQVVHTNNPADSSKSLTDIYANDPNLMRRPGLDLGDHPTAVSRWTSGTYAYDGAGNVKAIGSHTFTYDKVSRLTAANLYLEPMASITLRTQTFGYDAFGNLLAFGGSSARNTPTTPGTNHLTGATYDGSGNVIAWNGNAYTYDRPAELGKGVALIAVDAAASIAAEAAVVGVRGLLVARGAASASLETIVSSGTKALARDAVSSLGLEGTQTTAVSRAISRATRTESVVASVTNEGEAIVRLVR